MNQTPIYTTTILGVRLGRQVAMGGDGQVTMGEMQLKSRAVKVRAFAGEKVLGGFAGAVADALTLFEKFEAKLEEYSQNLQRAAVELAKEWRTDKYLRELDAFLALMDRRNSYILSGSGDVIDPEDNVISIGSGSGYAMAAARALIKVGEKNPKTVVKTALEITADICIYSNDQLTILELR
ncbi:MAG: ATP-dependent protease subunit HslV [Fidelibacterota bacterium]|nr:MAG: ATP-dependent protease subunit HslV [Candidatus Neomarinimicrobiota bacterium]